MHGDRKESAAGVNGVFRWPDADVFRHALQLVVVLVVGLSTLSGCRSFRPSDGEGLFAKSDLLNTDKLRGPLELYGKGERRQPYFVERLTGKGARGVVAVYDKLVNLYGGTIRGVLWQHLDVVRN